ncbi:GNAT family N-acetyltransferase [Actinopolyspora mortivallis]|uniref:GNAT family N-acetyltransferase n=1 Tax=Actinopolyspora mortivallis TaxID=33906 RepID=UPI000375B612|nr:GNAT family N-acetyltransferase [Actinopolyspora mortivallis]
MTGIVFRRTDDRLGEFAVRHVDPDGDVELLHRWLTHPKSAFWLMNQATVDDVSRQFHRIAATPGHDALLGLHEGTPAFVAERYDLVGSDLDGVHTIQPGDVGMHFLVAPTDTPVHGFTLAVLRTVMELLFADPANQRVVVEPDVRNTAVHRMNRAVGFEELDTVSLPGKTALLSTCTRSQYHASLTGPATEQEVPR